MITLWTCLCAGDILLQRTDTGLHLPQGDDAPVELKPWNVVTTLTMHSAEDTDTPYIVKVIRLDHPVISRQGLEMMNLRASFENLSAEEFTLAGKAAELIYWDLNTKYCGCCGAPMKLHTEISKRCTNCGKEVWPQLATAIIVRITRQPEDEILLVHATNFRGPYFGLVAGFVETGESLEDAVRREVREETGLEVCDLHYFGSQPWPFPCGLMVGFTATYASGKIRLQRSELSDGGWYSRSNLPAIPGKVSIARRLIDDWLNIQS